MFRARRLAAARDDRGPVACTTSGMRSDSGERRQLENAFSILRFRRRGVVSFRRFVVLNAWPSRSTHDLQFEGATTQPMRTMR
ncbi:MAG TPA: hypothetical protein VFK02_21710 [Kofleriaceae bacterium]|nr:hypothetical protein [Kofleriaceae bacterium]